jgi:hypothetical protein
MELTWLLLALIIPLAVKLWPFTTTTAKMPIGPIIALSHGGGTLTHH